MKTIAMDALIVSHAAIPWVVAARRLFVKERKLPPPPDPADAEAEAKTETAPKHANPSEHVAFRCQACGGTVPLADEPFACPFCGEPIRPPKRIVNAYRRRLWADKALARAERAWKRAVLYNAPIWIVVAGVIHMIWAGWYLRYLIVPPDPNDLALWPKLGMTLLYMSIPSGALAWWVGAAFAFNAYSWPRLLPKLPRNAFSALPPERVECSNCGAEIEFAEGRFGVVCRYCGSEEIRPSLAKQARDEARSVEKSARQSIIEAYRAIANRRENFFLFFDVLAGAQVVFGIYLLLEQIPYVGPLLEGLQAL